MGYFNIDQPKFLLKCFKGTIDVGYFSYPEILLKYIHNALKGQWATLSYARNTIKIYSGLLYYRTSRNTIKIY